MAISRRKFLMNGAAAAGVPLGATLGMPYIASAQSGDFTVVGIMEESGVFQAYGRPKANALRMAVEETNAAGGLLGRKIRLVQYDTQSNNQLVAQYGQQIALKDKATIAFGMVTSAAREILRPIFRKSNTLYFYNMPYEGGLCDRNTFTTGISAAQNVGTLVPYLIKRFGKKIYILGPDYNYGQISEAWIRKFAADNGAQVVGSELFPLDAANFSATISKIQAAAPDVVIDSFVTPPQQSFYSQWAAAGMKSKIGMASQTFGNGGHHLQTPKEVTEGIIICYEYVQEMDNPASKAFVKKFRDRFGPQDYIGGPVLSEYIGWQLWSGAVKQAKSFDRASVMKVLESGMEIDTPCGRVRLDPATHHCVYDMQIAEIHDGGLKPLDMVKQVGAVEMIGQCDLIKSPNTNTLFQPKI
jgi:urea transport system substrate-binding protein